MNESVVLSKHTSEMEVMAEDDLLSFTACM
jgi:hypothetical protein